MSNVCFTCEVSRVEKASILVSYVQTSVETLPWATVFSMGHRRHVAQQSTAVGGGMMRVSSGRHFICNALLQVVLCRPTALWLKEQFYAKSKSTYSFRNCCVRFDLVTIFCQLLVTSSVDCPEQPGQIRVHFLCQKSVNKTPPPQKSIQMSSLSWTEL